MPSPILAPAHCPSFCFFQETTLNVKAPQNCLYHPPKCQRVAMSVNLRDLAESMSVADIATDFAALQSGINARMPKFPDLGMLVKFARSQPMLPKTPNVLPKHPNCQTCRTIRCLHKCATIVHNPCLPVVPSGAKLSIVNSCVCFSQKCGHLAPPPQPIHFQKPFSRRFQKGMTYPPPLRDT